MGGQIVNKRAGARRGGRPGVHSSSFRHVLLGWGEALLYGVLRDEGGVKGDGRNGCKGRRPSRKDRLHRILTRKKLAHMPLVRHDPSHAGWVGGGRRGLSPDFLLRWHTLQSPLSPPRKKKKSPAEQQEEAASGKRRGARGGGPGEVRG
uniref:Uncharacterized protein n=1 Tax=Molossus molossus TaxID=27622 RepID=A0A7J8DC54_MOLMO|nr:hypothetical protein HJG59_009364 [Molossus molossus]